MIPKEYREFLELIKRVHKELIEETGGVQGIRDEGGLEYSMYKILKLAEKKENAERVAAFTYLELRLSTIS